eukprot:898093_1
MSNHYQSSHHKQNKHNGQKYNSSNKHVEKYGSQSQHRSGGQSTPRTEQRSRQKVAAFDIKATLDKVPLLSSLGKSQKRQLAKELITKVFHPGQDIMREGEEGDFFLIIIDGKVDVKSSKAGHLAFLGEGDYAGEQALLKATTRNATLTAVDTTTCLLCSKHTFDKIKKSVKFANREGKKRRAFATKVNKDDMKMPAVEAKPQETVEWILECVSDNLLFLKLDRDQKERVVQRMVLVKVAKGKALIRQGDTNAQTFYVTDRGTFDILVDGVKVGQYKRGGCFGELALLYDSPRAATILATSTAAVWEVNRNAFRNHANVNFLKRMDLFKSLLREELYLVADALELTKHKKGSVIIAEGEVGDKFYIIQRGVCEWSKSDGQCGDISAPGFFGERALRTKAKRAATITAKTNVTLYEMTKGDFESLLGPVIEIVDDKIRQYRRMQEKFEKEKRKSELLAQKEMEVGKDDRRGDSLVNMDVINKLNNARERRRRQHSSHLNKGSKNRSRNSSQTMDVMTFGSSKQTKQKANDNIPAQNKTMKQNMNSQPNLRVFHNDKGCEGCNGGDPENCISFKRISTGLKYYSVLDVATNKNDEDIFAHFVNEVYKLNTMHNDYAHIIRKHQHQMQDIKQLLINKGTFDECTLSKCMFTTRHYAAEAKEESDDENTLDPL